MSQSRDFQWLKGPALALALATAGGSVGAFLGIPAGWFTGGMVAVSIAALAGLRVGMPARVVECATVMIGILLGAGVTPEVVAGIPTWPVSLAILAASVVVTQIVMQIFLVRVGGWDRQTAYFAALPGAMIYALAGAAESGADVRRVAINQLTRVFLLIALLPTIATVVAPGIVAPERIVASPYGMLLLLGVGIPCALLFRYFRVPVGLLTGALIASAALHGGAVVEGTFPEPVLIATFVIFGASVGVRFVGTTFRYLLENAPPVFGAFILGVGIAFLFAYAVTLLVDAPLDQLLIAFAPGALDAMIAIALALNMDSAFVAAHQMFRMMGVVLFAPFGARLSLGRAATAKAEDPAVAAFKRSVRDNDLKD